MNHEIDMFENIPTLTCNRIPSNDSALVGFQFFFLSLRRSPESSTEIFVDFGTRIDDSSVSCTYAL